ncbi:DegT/DnrJ/EryC1/StrS family aminotransferase [Ampullimonas aquatilis]|uniref:DegT/DnrJ/EryC1/StrS family aminotransferase n=1 Tax=Ampullimonas aquatilis TaxID=1341549 RepID=UPI003C711AE3
MIPLFSAAIANSNVNFVDPIKRVLDRHWYVLGEEVSNFEAEFARYIGVSHCISVANGTDALEIALRSLNIQAGDKVVTVANAGFYSSTAIYAVGATPVYADIDPKTMTMSPKALKYALNNKPSAIIVTHIFGQLANIEELAQIALDSNIPLIEDCAQAHGARRNGKIAGSFGDIACFSFYPTKNLGALGDGGAVVTNDVKLAGRLTKLRQYGWGTKYQVICKGGFNSRLDEIQAAILREKLPYLNSWNNERRQIAIRYNDAFSIFPEILLPLIGEDYVAHLYVIRLEKRDEFRLFLKKHGIASDIHYPIPDHLQTAYFNNTISNSLSITEAACAQLVSLPCFPGLSMDEVSTIITAVKAWFSN